MANESVAEITEVVKKDSIKKKKEIPTDAEIDSIKQKLDSELKKSFVPIPASARKKILEEVEKEARDTTATKEKDDITFNFGGMTRLDTFTDYVKEYPNSKMDVALDSLGFEKNFTNRFLFTRAKTLYSFTEDEDSRDKFFSQILSSGSISLFILLPFFTLFLKFFYIRRKFGYVDHLIFVFHVQTVFFMLFAIFFLLKLFGLKPELWIFTILFLLYLLIAMKKFYQQGYIKTFFKFILLNISYSIVATIGIIFVFLISFALF
ncbi:hypothetical protein BW723_09390 [Polaribacter reichenbachii]|uniref:DUF3667 domain-containing protein n=1 Tax=Polaribacter reichenbachii TaxID=996801 RepID=A0A1B8U769_9FLAO|nr:hypothetical protein [Polaribacter reichenbachii]APZ46497.1 hypothetical protein BW723_09390 [Polaribacter reichenbachii]AUC20362.1 hypothetical protein BTO17_17425 [Polaribacter reichenbachii]OBY67736.1 hypothetical protein LPB301_00110 [Polaribacter reichenbachii]